MSEDQIISIAIVDDHNLFRQGMISLLSEFREVHIIFDAPNGAVMKQKMIEGLIPEVVLLDISMPIVDGYQAAAWIKENYPQTRILALSMFEEDKPIIKMLKSGAGGYLLKESKTTELVDAIKTIKQQGYYLNDLVSGKLLKNIQDNTAGQSLTSELNPNEIRFLQLCCSEYTYKEIAEHMNLSPHTIDNYRQEIFQKFDIKSRTGLVLFALKHDLVEL
ncbi:ligand-binding protein SH3 [Pedobacter antarcticus 4BY]|uniref:Ligand-binding protein SH3 n=2 Tax=Pedobacter antarcticus TaxID=34086 RepID=A0A081PD59_9SPHI|nr:response regulator transcription factor [Pedobacter antarcticus]KEQ28632.1 ligand-binding protein SH3 [Pedobacter antarcticus 4BY]SFE87365.1 two component transcriptional regulator, LuxR family [Pedobacter antarcticus]